MNLGHLYAFREVARLESVGAAARSVHLSQPALTQAIAGIERLFGARLLNRSNLGVSLTEAGRICLARVERALAQLHEGMTEIGRESPARPGSDLGRRIRVPQLDAMTAVVEHRNFSAAARARGLSQPTLYRAARDLERLLGVPLFEKTSFGIVPTREAERLARRVKLLFSELEQARAEITALGGGETGRTVIGSMPLARTHLIPAALIDFTAEFPQHRVAILDGAYEALLGALKSGGADFLVGAMRDPERLTGVVQEHLFDDPLAIVMRAGHPLASRRHVPRSLLLNYPWIAPRADSPLRLHFNELFALSGLEPPAAPIECNSLAASRALLIESDRLILLSANQVQYELKAGLLVALPHPAGRVVRPIGLTMRQDWRPTHAQTRLLHLLRQRSQERSGRRAITSRK